MIDRRTFLKLSAGALVLTAAGALTGCGTIMDLDHPNQEVDGVMFLCDVIAKTDFSSGEGKKVQYKPYFAIWNQSGEDVSIPRKDITGTFTENGCEPEKMVFIPSGLNVSATTQYQVFSRYDFCLETENSIPPSHENATLPSRENGTYELRIKYKGKTVVFFYNGKTVTGSVE